MKRPRGNGGEVAGRERALPTAGDEASTATLQASHRRAAEVLRRLRTLQERVVAPREPRKG